VDVLAALAPFLQAPLTIHGSARFSNRAFFCPMAKRPLGDYIFLTAVGELDILKNLIFEYKNAAILQQGICIWPQKHRWERHFCQAMKPWPEGPGRPV
jgi:hypothetical protein